MYKLRSVVGDLVEGMRITIQKHYSSPDETMTRQLRNRDIRRPIICSMGRLDRIDSTTYDIKIYDLISVKTLFYVTTEPIIKGQSVIHKTYYMAVRYDNNDEKKQICTDLINDYCYEENLLEIFGLVETVLPTPVDLTATEITPLEPVAPAFNFNISTSTEVEIQPYDDLTMRDYENFVSQIRTIKQNMSNSWLRNATYLGDIVFNFCTFKLNEKDYIGRYFEVEGFPFVLYLEASHNTNLLARKTIKLIKLYNSYLDTEYTPNQLEQIRTNFKNFFSIITKTSDDTNSAINNKPFRGSLLFHNKVGSDINYFESQLRATSDNMTINELLLDCNRVFSYKRYVDYNNFTSDYVGNFNCATLTGNEDSSILYKKYRDQAYEENKKYILIKNNDKYYYYEFKDDKLCAFLKFYEFPSLFLIYNNLYTKLSGNFNEVKDRLRTEFGSLINSLAIDGIFSHFYKKY